jgi:hypothetical protein
MLPVRWGSGSSRRYPKANSHCRPSEAGWTGFLGWRFSHSSHTDTSRSANQALGYARCTPIIWPLAQYPLRLHAAYAADSFETPRLLSDDRYRELFRWRTTIVRSLLRMCAS